MKKIAWLVVLLCLGGLVFQPGDLTAAATTKKHKPENQNTLPLDSSKMPVSKPYLFLCTVSQVYPPLLFMDLRLNLLRDPNPNTLRFQLPELRLDQPKHRFGRALLQLTGHFVYATSSYWIRQDVMKEDWEYQFTWEDQKKRFLFIDGMRFDSNTFQFNWTHSLAGAMYYNYARANRLSPMQSFLFGFGASYLWEFFVEFKEVVSINDSISTPMGGLSIGESLYQLGRYFRSQRPTLLNKIARIFSNPILSLNELLYKKKNTYDYTFEGIDYWNDFRMYLGPRFDSYAGNSANSFLQLGLETQLNLIPEYGKPEASARFINSTAFTEFNIGAAINKKGLYEFDIFAKSVLFGYFSQDIRPIDKPHRDAKDDSQTPAQAEGETGDYDNHNGYMDSEDSNVYKGHHDGGYQGYSFFWGLGTCFDVVKKNPDVLDGAEENRVIPGVPDETDKYCIINLLGPTVDFSVIHKDLKIRLAADAYGDFALIHSHAFKNYSELNPIGKTKSTLENHGYYYALGITLSSLLQVNYSNFEFRGNLKYHYFNSIEGLDRFQKELPAENDVDLKDHRWRYNINLGYRIPNTSLQLVLGWEQWKRKGSVEDFVRQSTERRSYFQIKYLF